MSFTAILIVALGTAGGVTYLINYAPLAQMGFKNKIWSPRLMICKLLTPFDIVGTLFLTFGSVLGIGTMVTGISMLFYNILVGAGLSIAVGVIKKWIMPYWEKRFERIKIKYQQTGILETR